MLAQFTRPPCGQHYSTRRQRRIVQAKCSIKHPDAELSSHLRRAAAASTAVLYSLSFWLQPCSAEELSIAFPASANPEIRRAQQMLVESWAYVDNLYVDQQPSHKEWAKALQDALAASFKAMASAEVTEITRNLLATLKDPYTRILQAEENAALTAEQEGKIVATGLGLQQVLQPSTEELHNSKPAMSDSQELLVVSFVVEGSPAAAAGIKEGDLVLQVAGQPTGGKELRQIYRLLSQEADVTLARQPPLLGSNQSPGSRSSSSSQGNSILTEAAAPGMLPAAVDVVTAADGALQGEDIYKVHLKPAPLDFEPVQYGIIDLDTSQSSSSSSLVSKNGNSNASSRVGYLKVLTFSATAPQEVAEALQDMQREAQQQQRGLAGLIVDLRDNPGGLVEAGVDIAMGLLLGHGMLATQDFLQAGQVLGIVVDKSGVEEKVVLPQAHTLSQLPLVLLVNHSTASTSELLAGALHDELSAPLIGSTTYGKGRSQRVIPLSDGSTTLLVSTLKYFTPKHNIIDEVGLKPDVACDPEQILGRQWLGGRFDQQGQDTVSLLDDPCIKLAAERLAGSG